MGTGSTSSGPCRVGSNNYPQLLFEKIGEAGVKVEKKMCSGDTTTGLARRIREWSSASTANITTLSPSGVMTLAFRISSETASSPRIPRTLGHDTGKNASRLKTRPARSCRIPVRRGCVQN
ncbi:hypothetical protein BDW60DRAFT_200380 [Aspergillus nidulans var. acristatus]